MTELLPPELSDLIAAERAAPVASAASRMAVRSKLAASVGLAPLGHAAAGGVLLGTAKVLAILALVVGAGTVALVRRTSPSAPKPAATISITSHEQGVAAEPAPPIDVAPVAPATTTRLAPVPILPAPRNAQVTPDSIVRAAALTQFVGSPPAEPVPDVAAPAPSPGSPVSQPITSQAELLRRAWAASSAHDGARALALVLEDEQLHPRGPLIEERDALRIAALVELHRDAEARLAATTFFVSNPTSVHRAMIDRAIGALKPETP